MKRAGAAVLLLAALGLAWWGYAEYRKRELHAAVVALVTDATARVRDALQVRDSDAEELERLESHFKALAAAAQRLQKLDTWRNPPLGDAAQQYVDEGHALLRRKIALLRCHAKVLAGVDSLAAHLQSARGRSSRWIEDAVALKQALEREFFDCRLAEGGLRKSLQALPVARQDLQPLVAPAALIDDRAIGEARAQLDATVAAVASRVETARKLPLAR